MHREHQSYNPPQQIPQHAALQTLQAAEAALRILFHRIFLLKSSRDGQVASSWAAGPTLSKHNTFQQAATYVPVARPETQFVHILKRAESACKKAEERIRAGESLG